LAREIRFQIILFGLKVLRYSTTISAVAQWRLKDQILSAALSWFSFAPRWSFGGNRLQLKAEMRLMADVAAALQSVRNVGFKSVGPLNSLLPEEELLNVLLENEQSRLAVWLNPLGGDSGPMPKDPSDVSLNFMPYHFLAADIIQAHSFEYCENSMGCGPIHSRTPDDEISFSEASQ
jgi:hypothetical protein